MPEQTSTQTFDIQPTEEAINIYKALAEVNIPEHWFNIVYHTVFKNPERKADVLTIAKTIARAVEPKQFLLVFYRAISDSGLQKGE